MSDNIYNELEIELDDAKCSEVSNATDIKKCQSCGANLTWNPTDKCLLCEHCGTKQIIDLNRFGEELNFAAMLKDNHSWAEETHVYRCNNCGAREVLSKDEIAVRCSFCGTTNVIETDEISGLKPNAVIPFNIDKTAACVNVIAWAKKRLLAPSGFKKSVVPEELSGNYNPSFTFDTETVTSYSGVLGRYYYVDKKVNGKVVRERRTRYISISGTYNHFYDDILIQASTMISQKTVNKLQPFNTNHCNEYSQDFLHGFTASQYTRDGESCWNEARGFIESDVKGRILAKYSYDFVQSFSPYTSCNNIKFKYILLPIYVGYCRWKKKIYNFFVNGRSGKVYGKTPISLSRILSITAIGLLISAGVSAIYWFISNGSM